MAAPFRELRPAPLAVGQELASSSVTASRSKNRASLACQPCREKRRKCSGDRPECKECSRRLLRCLYEAAPGQTRMASMKENHERMKTDLDTMMELYWYLQTKPKEEVGDALSAIQSGANPSEVMEGIKSRMSAASGTPNSSTASQSNTPFETRSTSDQQSSYSSSHVSRQSAQSISPSRSDGLRIQTPSEMSTVPSPTGPTGAVGGVVTESSLQRTIDSLGKGAVAFFSCTGCIFHIYDQAEAEKMLTDIRPHLENSGKSWLELVFQGSIPAHLKPGLCSLCIMAAVGLQYTKNPIPALGFQSSGEDGSYEFVSVFYESARHLLESVIEVNVLEAMKVCAALCIFNTIGHATIAMAYADMGINFVLSLGPSLQYRPKSLDEDTWIKYKRVARTLVTLRSWLIATLGYVHKENVALQTGIQWLVDAQDLTPNETIQQELHKVVQIEANLLRTIDSFRDISPVLLSSTRRDLARWHKELPAWMHLSSLINPAGSVVIFRRTVFLVHLFYLSASILLARLAHGAQKLPPADGTALLPRYDIAEVKIAAGDGVHAARTAARILQLQMDEQAVFQRCWNCEFAAFMSCLILLHSAAQMQLHDYPQSTWRKELGHARSCLSVLEYCSKADKVAENFAEVTSGYYNVLAAQIQNTGDISVCDPPDNFEYLFSVPTLSHPQLQQISRDLLKRVSCPFDAPSSSLHDEATLRAGLGSHITLAFNNSPPKEQKSWSAVEMALSGMPTGQFVGSSQPHGWDVFLNLNTM